MSNHPENASASQRAAKSSNPIQVCQQKEMEFMARARGCRGRDIGKCFSVPRAV